MAGVADWPTISNLIATGSAGSVSLATEYVDPHQPDGHPALKTTMFEYFASQTDDEDTRVKVAEGFASAKHDELIAGDTWYYWVRPRRESYKPDGTKAYTYGDFYPVDGYGGQEVRVFSDSDDWVEYTPVVTAGTGTIAAYEASGRYKIVGTTCQVRALITIIGAGTASGNMNVTLPFPGVGAFADVGFGRAGGGTMLSCNFPTGGDNFVSVVEYDGGDPFGVSEYKISVDYEIAA